MGESFLLLLLLLLFFYYYCLFRDAFCHTYMDNCRLAIPVSALMHSGVPLASIFHLLPFKKYPHQKDNKSKKPKQTPKNRRTVACSFCAEEKKIRRKGSPKY